MNKKEMYEDLKKALHRAIAKAYKNGNSMVEKALEGQDAVSHIVADIEDSDMHAEVPGHMIPAESQSVLHKDTNLPKSPEQAMKQIKPFNPAKDSMSGPGIKSLADQKQANIQAQDGNPMNGIGKLKKFMDSKLMKKQGPCWEGYEKVTGKADFSEGSCKKK